MPMSGKKPSNAGKSSHDKFYRGYMINKKAARELIMHYAPEEWRAQMNLATLAYCKTDFVEPSLKNKHADILYSVEMKNGRSGYCYLLIEHQSTNDKMMMLRMRRYQLNIIEQHLKSTNDKYIPTIFPFVVYNGLKQYTAPRNWFDLYAPEERAFNKKLSQSPCVLIDIQRIPDEQLRTHAHVGYMLWLLKHIFKGFLYDIINSYKDFNNLTDRELNLGIQYIFEYRDIKDMKDVDTLLESNRLEHDIKERVMTIAENLIERGIVQGEERKAKVVAADMLKEGFDIKIIMKITKLSKKEILSIQNEH